MKNVTFDMRSNHDNIALRTSQISEISGFEYCTFNAYISTNIIHKTLTTILLSKYT